MTKPLRRWAVGNVHTGNEVEVIERLERDGLEVYCPRYVRKIKRRRKVTEIEKAVFPGYLFIDDATIGNEESVYEVEGFHYFLRYPEGGKKYVRDSAIDGLRALERRGVFLPTSLDALIAKFTVGDKVKVDGGPFGGMCGTVISEAKGRAMVAGVDFKFATEIPVESLEVER